MNNKTFIVLIALCLTSFTSCSQNNGALDNKDVDVSNQKDETIKTEPHRYGGWYCPDNLNGFPAVDIKDWKNVPVINGRMATNEETQNGTSLIFVDAVKYPNAKVLDMVMPKLARYYSDISKRDEVIIVIQAINVDNDSIVGFRYLNGGNGSARLNEVKFVTDKEIANLPQAKFVTHNIKINATQDAIWEVLTNLKYAEKLRPSFDKDNKLKNDWRKSLNVNYSYPNTGDSASWYADLLYGNYYIQNDYDLLNFSEKFFVSENKQTKTSDFIIVCGPYGDDFEAQKDILNNWGQKVKELSERE